MNNNNSNNQEETTQKSDSNYVNIKVNGQDGSEVFFKVLKKAQLRKLMKKYCERQALEQRIFAFLVDGHPINGTQTPDELGLEDGDEIDAMKHHGGGGGGVKWVIL